MKYISLDVETTGLDPQKHQILEIAMVADDLSNPRSLDRLPVFHKLVTQPDDEYIGSITALTMNANLLHEIRHGGERPRTTVDTIANEIHTFIRLNYVAPHDTDERAVMAGKNLAGFDIPFLRNLPGGDLLPLDYAVLDVGPLYLRTDDTRIPHLNKCLERAGVDEGKAHQALSDAMAVVKLIRHHFGVPYEKEYQP